MPRPLPTFGPDHLEDSLEILEDIRVPESQDLQPLLLKIPLTKAILLFFPQVRFPIQFKDESANRTVEVRNVGLDDVLTPEAKAGEPASAQFSPEDLFRGRLATTQDSGIPDESRVLFHQRYSRRQPLTPGPSPQRGEGRKT